jgi:hypothetical protein
MSSTGWIRLENFNLPLSLRIKYSLVNLLAGRRIRVQYRNHSGDTLIRVEFDGEYLNRVLSELSSLLKEWGRQNNLQI